MDFFSARNITMKFGGLTAVDGFNLTLHKGELAGIIGPNGAGKTTVFNMISGYYQPTSGTIDFMGSSIAGRKANRITKLGIARTFQNIRLFPDLTVMENVTIARHCRIRSSFIEAVLRLPRYTREEKEMRELALGLLAEVGLEDVAGENILFAAIRQTAKTGDSEGACHGPETPAPRRAGGGHEPQ